MEVEMNKSKRKIILSILTLCLALVCTFCMPNQASAAKIKLSKKSVTITKGKSVTLKLKGTKKKPKWSTSNKKVATVSKKGKVTGKKAGNAKITAKVGKKKYVCKVKVVKAKSVPEPKPAPQPVVDPNPVPPSNKINGINYRIYDEGVVVYKYEGNAETFVVPSEIENRPVTEIVKSTFKGCNSLVSIEVPDSVTTIGEGAFANCQNLKTVKLSANLKEIEESMFFSCPNLTNIEIPNGVTYIGRCAFYNCINLTNVTIPPSVTSMFTIPGIDIASHPFVNCPKLTISGYANTRAERFAKYNNIPFNLIE